MTISIADLTSNIATDSNNKVTGDGNFDKLMEAVTAHLDAQFALGRISGTDYATVYLGAMQSVIAQSVNFVLGVEKTNADVALTVLQGTQVSAQTALTNQQQLTEVQNTDLVNKRVATEVAQELQVDAQTALLTQQQLSEVQNTALITARKSLTDNQASTELARELQVDAETSLVTQREVTEWSQTEQATNTAPTATSVVGVAKAKTTAEVGLLDQKCITEFAQTNQTTKIAADTSSILGRQAALYAEQAKGFKWNADQKYLKTLLDAWSINISTAGVAATGVTALNEVGVGNINDKIAAAEPTG